KELGDEHCPAVLAPQWPPPGQRGAGKGGSCARSRPLSSCPDWRCRGQRMDPRPDERVVGGKGSADRRIGGALGGSERRLQQPPGLRRIDLLESGAARSPPRLSLARRRCPGAARLARRVLAAAATAIVQQLAYLRGNPAVAGHAAGVVLDDDDERVLLL